MKVQQRHVFYSFCFQLFIRTNKQLYESFIHFSVDYFLKKLNLKSGSTERCDFLKIYIYFQLKIAFQTFNLLIIFVTNFIKFQKISIFRSLIMIFVQKYFLGYSPFRLRSLIYAERFELKNPVITQDKQCKQTERFSVMAKGSKYFFVIR